MAILKGFFASINGVAMRPQKITRPFAVFSAEERPRPNGGRNDKSLFANLKIMVIVSYSLLGNNKTIDGSPTDSLHRTYGVVCGWRGG